MIVLEISSLNLVGSHCQLMSNEPVPVGILLTLLLQTGDVEMVTDDDDDAAIAILATLGMSIMRYFWWW